MADILTPAERSERMRRVRQKGTAPELAVRAILTKMGVRYRLNYGKLPGRPDIVLLGRKKAIFVHGCFWHGHSCRQGRLPQLRKQYWRRKIGENRRRDAKKERLLKQSGFDFLIVWQCELRQAHLLLHKIRAFLQMD